MNTLASKVLLSLLVMAPLAGCEYLDPDQWRGHGGTGAGGSGGGVDGKMCGGIAGLQCPRDQFCEIEAGACGSIADASGVCKVKSEICPANYAPVCGCDGKTYGNDCGRQAAGVSRLHDGACKSDGGGEGATCDGIAGLPCADGLFCEFDTGVCSSIADASGTCRRKPEVCDLIGAPVCGCDGKTYGNDCERQGAGVSKLSNGACARHPGEGELCGGIAGFACAAGLFCEMEAGTCGVADGAGVCKPRPQACTTDYRPVCGCDGRTYANDCGRQSSGAAKAHNGACEATPPPTR